jgi:hypothetical protein
MSIQIPNDLLEKSIFNNTVITTLTNYGYILYTLNMLKSLRPYGLDKTVLIIAVDTKCYRILNNLGYNVCCIENNNLGKFCPWNTEGYDKICYLKLELIYRVLSHNKNILLIDGDIVFQKDPRTDINKWITDKIHDVYIQNDSDDNRNTRNMCTGYMFIRTSNRLIELYDCVSPIGKKKYMECAFDNNDQTYFNKFVKPGCIISPLPLNVYPNGKYFYEKSDEIKNTIVLVHFNWVHGHHKMAKMKEHKMWLLSPEEEEYI